jgi:hypothetical protein
VSGALDVRDAGAGRGRLLLRWLVGGEGVGVGGFWAGLRAVHGPEEVGEIGRVNFGHVRHRGSGRLGGLPFGVEGGVLDRRADVEAADLYALAGHCRVQ